MTQKDDVIQDYFTLLKETKLDDVSLLNTLKILVNFERNDFINGLDEISSEEALRILEEILENHEDIKIRMLATELMGMFRNEQVQVKYIKILRIGRNLDFKAIEVVTNEDLEKMFHYSNQVCLGVIQGLHHIKNELDTEILDILNEIISEDSDIRLVEGAIKILADLKSEKYLFKAFRNSPNTAIQIKMINHIKYDLSNKRLKFLKEQCFAKIHVRVKNEIIDILIQQDPIDEYLPALIACYTKGMKNVTKIQSILQKQNPETLIPLFEKQIKNEQYEYHIKQYEKYIAELKRKVGQT